MPTFDGQPHGALTNHFIAGLKGAADADHDGKVSLEELYQFTRFWVAREYHHSPQLLFHAGDSLSAAALGTGALPVKNDFGPIPKTVLVKVSGGDRELTAALPMLPRVILADHGFEFLVESRPDGTYAFGASDGQHERTYARGRLQQLLTRVASQPLASDLIEACYPDQDFSATLEVVPEEKAVYRKGDVLNFRARSAKAGLATLLDIDALGVVTVLAANEKILAQNPSPLGLPVRVEDPPFGTEYVKLLVDCGGARFPWKRDAEIQPDDPAYRKLLALATAPGPCRAQTTLQVVTSDQ